MIYSLKIWIRLLCLTLSLQITLAAKTFAGGDFVGNGGGIAEKNFLFALGNIEKYMQLCLELKACRLDYAQQNLLALMIEAMPQEKKQEQVLIFISEKKAPGTFFLDNEVKVAKTGSTIGSPIFINTDLIYSQNSFGAYEAVSISEALAILIHEFGHHVTQTSHEQLDLLGVKVAAFIQNQIQHSPALPWNPSVSASVISFKQKNTFPQILLNVGNDVLDISQEFLNSVYCSSVNIPIPILPVPDISLGNTRPLGAVYHNVHWDSFGDESGGSYQLTGNLTKFCENESLFVFDNSFKAIISFKASINPNSQQLELDKNTVKIRQEYKPWYKLIKLPF
ncbi:MAG: hypothetical protein ACK5WZ_05985 [Pseudobdellovibrionaceae bacterium]